MSSPSVGQLSYLSGVFRELLARFRPSELAFIGCATGNGFEHIPPDTRRAVGIDINLTYLDILRRRFGDALPGLELICTDLSARTPSIDPVDLVHCALVFEYLSPSRLVRAVSGWLRPGGVMSVVLQLPASGAGVVSKTVYPSLESLGPIMRLVDPEELGGIAADAGLAPTMTRVDTLDGGKTFFVGCFERARHDSR